MADEVLERVAKQVERAEQNLARAKYLREFLVEAGEDTAEITRQISRSEKRIRRYRKALARRKVQVKGKG